MLHKYFIAIIFLVAVFNAYGQSQLDSLEYIETASMLNNLTTSFNKQLNTYNLNSGLQADHKDSNLHYWLTENYNSTYIKSYDRSSRDEQYFSFAGNYKINSLFNLGLAAENNILSDSRKIEINQASISDATIFSQIYPVKSVIIAPFFGYENNRQIGENDNGYVYGGEGYVDNLDVSNFDIQSQLKFKNEDISPRKNALRYLTLSVINKSSNEFSNQINYQYFLNRKDFYFPADSNTMKEYGITNNIQSRIETYNILQDKLLYSKFLNIFTLDVTGRLTWRGIDRNTRYRPTFIASTSLFDTKINEMRLEFESGIRYKSDIFTGSLKTSYSERSENHIAKNYPGASKYFFDQRSEIEAQKNNNSKRISIAISGNLNLSHSDIISFSMYQNKLVYNTPSPLNYDDRDELLSIVRLQYEKKLSPFFSTFINAEGTYNHIVYIYSEKSSNNNVNRILRFAAGGTYNGKNVSSFNSFDVSANYTVYDFEDLLPNYTSYSFRQFSATDSSRIKFPGDLSFAHFGYIRLSEQGDLKWASFSTHPTRFLKEIFSEPKIITSYNRFIFALGIRYYSLTTYQYKVTQRVPNSEYNSIGPLTEITFSMKKSLNLSLTGWYEFINSENIHKQQASLSMQVVWNF